jgi:hypothetical protein
LSYRDNSEGNWKHYGGDAQRKDDGHADELRLLPKALSEVRWEKDTETARHRESNQPRDESYNHVGEEKPGH